jgi:hypothetical protein
VGRGIGKLGLGIDAVELGGLDQDIGDGGGTAASLRAVELIVFPADRNRSHRRLGHVVVQVQNAMVEIGPHPRHAGQGVADRDRRGAWQASGVYQGSRSHLKIMFAFVA